MTGPERPPGEPATMTAAGVTTAAAGGTLGVVGGAMLGGTLGFLVGTLLGMTIGESAGFWHAKGTKKAMLFKRRAMM